MKKVEKNDIVQPVVVFFEDSHTYWETATGRKLHSMSKYMEKVKPKYDRNYWLTHGAFKAIDENLLRDIKKEYFPKRDRSGKIKKHPSTGNVMFRTKPSANEFFPILYDKYGALGFSAEEIAKRRNELSDQWELKMILANVRGTHFHEKMEKRTYKRKWEINPYNDEKYDVKSFREKGKDYQNHTLGASLYDLEDGFYAELVIYDLDLGIAGQADKVWITTIDGKRYIDIDDYKSNEKMPSTSAMEMYKDPVSHIPASKLVGYEFQMTGYAYMLERAGFIPRHLQITWYKKYEVKSAHPIKLRYLKEDFEKILAA